MTTDGEHTLSVPAAAQPNDALTGTAPSLSSPDASSLTLVAYLVVVALAEIAVIVWYLLTERAAAEARQPPQDDARPS